VCIANELEIGKIVFSKDLDWPLPWEVGRLRVILK